MKSHPFGEKQFTTSPEHPCRSLLTVPNCKAYGSPDTKLFLWQVTQATKQVRATTASPLCRPSLPGEMLLAWLVCCSLQCLLLAQHLLSPWPLFPQHRSGLITLSHGTWKQGNCTTMLMSTWVAVPLETNRWLEFIKLHYLLPTHVGLYQAWSLRSSTNSGVFS